MLKIFSILLLSVSFSLLANVSDIKKDLKSQILENSKNDKVSFVVFNLDNVLIDINVRYESIFNRYLEEKPSKLVSNYFEKKSFVDVTLKEILNDIDKLKLTPKENLKLKGFLKSEFNSSTTLSSDIATSNSSKFVKDLYKSGAFIIYISKRNKKALVKTVDTLNSFEFPIGVNNTILIMNKDEASQNLERNILSKWIRMGKIIAVFNNNLKVLKSLKPYFKANQLFYINSQKIKDEKIKTIRGF